MAELIDKGALVELFEDKMFNSEIMCPIIKLADVLEILEEQTPTTEAEIRAKAIDEFAERCKELVKQGELYDYVRWCNWNNSVFKWFDRVAEQLKEE